MSHFFKICLFTPLLALTILLNSCSKGPKKFVSSNAEKGVVKIIAYDGKNEWHGSGFYIGDNIIITNHHVANSNDLKLLVVAHKIDTTSIEFQNATVEWSDKELDIAILKVPEIDCDKLSLSNAPIKKGSHAYAIGFPASADASRTAGRNKLNDIEKNFYQLLASDKRGIIKNLNPELVQILDPTVSSGEIRKTLTRKWDSTYSTKLRVIDHDVNIGHGNSGGPLFDAAGRVIGINTKGGGTIHDNVRNSSNITELIKVLESQNISAHITSTPTEDLLAPGTSWTTWLLLILVLSLIVYIAITLRNKPTSETIGQYAGRVSGYTRLQRTKKNDPQLKQGGTGPQWVDGKIISGQSTKTEPTPPVLPPQPQSPTRTWVLQGDSSSPHQIQLTITEELLRQYNNNLVLGRKQGVAHLVIDNSSISKSHAILSFRNGNFAIIDQSSANGTSINGTPLSPNERTRINPGDRLTLGEVTIQFNQIS